MGVLELMVAGSYEQVVHCHDGATGLRAIVAIHSTRLGPALGGTRCLPYPDEDAALIDVLRLARGMTYKAAAAGLDLGGGKAVIIGDPASVRTEALLRAYGRFLDGLGGRYLTAEDVGTTQGDMDVIRRETPYVTGTTAGSGDPSEATAHGVVHAMRAVAAREGWPAALSGARVSISGVGKVGGRVARLLAGAGATLTVADVDAARAGALADELGAAVARPEEAHRVACEIFSPCALGAVLTTDTIPELACRAIVGAANNQLAVPEDAERVAGRGIVYVPDFVVNAGGIINIAEELAPGGYDRGRAFARIAAIGGTVGRVLDLARAEGLTTNDAAERLADERLASGNMTPRSAP